MSKNVNDPQFGRWDDEHVPYATYLDSASKDKGGRLTAFSLTDHEDNPDVNSRENEYRKQHQTTGSIHSVKQHHSNINIDDHRFPEFIESPSPHPSGYRRVNLDPQRSTKLRSSSSKNISDKHHRVPSVPRFGDWDETDPRSAEGFSVIFEKVKEEKIGAANLQAEPTGLAVRPYRQRNYMNTSSRSKISCCLFPATKD